MLGTPERSRTGINDAGYTLSLMLWTGTMGLSVTGASGVGTVSGVAAASLWAWEMVEARWA